MRSVVFHPAASAELEDAIEYYDSKRRGLGSSLRSEVESATDMLQIHPEIAAEYKTTGLRRYVLRRFPYVLFYLVLPDSIWIVTVAHGRREPGYWKDRV